MKPIIALPETELTMESLRLQQEIASIEAFAGVEGLKSAVSRLPQIFSGAGAFYARFAGNLQTFLFPTRDLRDIAIKLDRHGYADVRTADVTVPEGLTTDLLSYTQLLLTSTSIAQSLVDDVLSPFEHYLATLVGDPQRLSQLSTNLNVPAMRLHQLEPVEKKINACFASVGKREAIVPFGKAFHRVADVRTLSAELEKLEKAFGKDDQKRIIQLTQRITEMLGEVITLIEGQDQKYRTSPAAVKAMSDTAFQVARELEHYGLVRYRLTELSNSVDLSMKQIGTWLNLQKAK